MKVYCKNCKYYHYDPDFCYPKYRNTGSDIHSCCLHPDNIRPDNFSQYNDKFISVPSIINEFNNCRWFKNKSSNIEYVWNGDPNVDYKSHGDGTYNVNPVDGLNGFYVGEKTLKEYFDQKRDKSDYKLYEPNNIHWVWSSNDVKCPEDFLNKVNSFGAPKPVFHYDTYGDGHWGNVIIRNPDGRIKYECVVTETGNPDDTSITFTFFTPNVPFSSFAAVATRESATDTSPVYVNGYENVRLANTSDLDGKANVSDFDVINMADYVMKLFSENNSTLTQRVEDIVNSMFDDGEKINYPKEDL